MPSRSNEYICRFNIPVHDALRVRRFQSVGNLDREGQQLFHLERMLADHQCERLPLQQLHNDKVLPLMLLDGVDSADVGMIESRGGASFALKAFQ